ncbi:MAG TPA: sigma-E factor regulatory protein RseB domain-containing protein [Mycobacterium sp.]|nr:sigma-E factor regulatory protein RseB domain-containing protein [Mycobacterium sp.]
MERTRVRTNLSRWLPAAIIPALIAGVALVAPLQASATQDLPAKNPQQVLAMVAGTQVHAFSGTMEQSSKLGLPELPAGEKFQNSPAATVLELLSGSHTARVYVDGPTKARVQVLDKLAERDAIRNGSDLWLYNSDDNTTVHATLPAKDATDGTPMHEAPNPATLGEKIVAALDPSTRVTIGDDTTVAGRTAYNLVLTPRTGETLVRSVSVAVDSETGLPLRVQVLARGQEKPAFQLGFTALTLTAPSADRFTFTPPSGSSVTEKKLPTWNDGAKKDAAQTPGEHQPPRVIGTGWSAIVEIPAGAVPQELLRSPLVAGATTAVAEGRLLHTSLLNVLFTTDGRVFVGSVPAAQLQAAAEQR